MKQDRTEKKLFAGLDWASKTHAVCVVDELGRIKVRFEISNTGKTFTGLVKRLTKLAVEGVAIERGDGPLVEAMLDAGLDVYVITPRQVKGLRTRYTGSGAKSDAGDAYLLADVLRTDGHRLTPLSRDSEATAVLRALSRTRKQLVEARVGLVNQLEAELGRVFPGAIGLFDRLDSNTAIAFLRAIETVRREERELEAEIVEHLEAHADAHIFTSLPKAGRGVRAAALLSEIGDVRARFPDQESLAALAGVAPVTRASGKMHCVGFRYACDKKLRNALIDFADDSRHASPWAANIYNQAIARGKRHPHAVRILARAWVRVIWRCWQDNAPYNPQIHGGAMQLAAA